jgi:YgiT-type zinc finger domain-containing protein
MISRRDGKRIKKCYACGGAIVKKKVDVEIEGIVVKKIIVEVCSKCGEKYFDTPTATFIQEVSSFVKSKKPQLLHGG